MNQRIWLSNSIFNKRVEVIKPDLADYMNSTVICPHCGANVLFNELYVVGGFSCCNKCRDQFIKELEKDKELDQENHLNKEYEPYGIDTDKEKDVISFIEYKAQQEGKLQ